MCVGSFTENVSCDTSNTAGFSLDASFIPSDTVPSPLVNLKNVSAEGLMVTRSVPAGCLILSTPKQTRCALKLPHDHFAS